MPLTFTETVISQVVLTEPTTIGYARGHLVRAPSGEFLDSAAVGAVAQ